MKDAEVTYIRLAFWDVFVSGTEGTVPPEVWLLAIWNHRNPFGLSKVEAAGMANA